MTNRTCSMPGCAKPYRARGMCVTHYNQQLPTRHQKVEMACAGCGVAVVKGTTSRYSQRFCSLTCRDRARAEDRRQHLLPVLHPLPTPPIKQRTSEPSAERQPRRFVSAQCGECKAWFVDRQTTARFCSPLCGKRWWRKEWKVRANRTIAPTVRTQVYQRDQGVCQLCFETVDMTLGPHDRLGPSLDHIICQSWTLVPDHTAGNLRLAHRLCNSLRGNRA